MSELIDKIIETENLHWAWKKVKNSFQVGDIWYDEIELATFEANLYGELEKIKDEVKTGTYTLTAIKPLPFPKGCDKETGQARVRQTFEICIRDQVIWMAVVNIIGCYLDYEMPWWSYGHRLYVPIWKNSNGQWDIGWYRHSKGQLYRKWNQSWPLFRRNISLTAKIMCRSKSEENGSIDTAELDEAEKSVYENNATLPNNFKSKYLEAGYWGSKSGKNLHWASIDFSKFYPKVKREVIVRNIFKYTTGADNDCEFKELINNIINFRIEHSQWSNDELSEIDLAEPDKFHGLPTGLFVAGFLANVALLDVDKQISENLKKNRDIAHFRFVDDHVVLAYNFDKLKDWIEKYKKWLDDATTGAEFNYQKIEPEALSHILNPEWCAKNKSIFDKEQENAKKETKLDPAFPAPLMTQTLAKVSAISRSDFEFLSSNEENQLISDLEHLLLTDFPDHELRKDTRVSFAASILSRIVPNIKDDYTDVYESQKRIHHKLKEYQQRFERKNKAKFIGEKLHELIFSESLKSDEYFSRWENEIQDEGAKELILSIKEEKKIEIELRKKIFSEKISRKEHIFKLLKKAITENPEKVRIWTRVIDYCKKVGYCNINEVYDKIRELSEQNSIHPLSVSFMKTLFMNVVADRIIHSVYLILNKNTLSYNEKEIYHEFFKSIFSDRFLKNVLDEESAETKSYFIKTCHFFRFALGSAIYILNHEKFSYKPDLKLIEQYRLIDWNSNPQAWVNNTHIHDINTWLYWLLWNTHDKSSSKPLAFWKKLQPFIDYENSSYKPLVQPFPNYEYLPKKDDDFFQFIINSKFDEGWLFEVFQTGKENISNNVKTALKDRYNNLYNNIFSSNNSQINLWEFIQWQQQNLSKPFDNELEFFNHYFDPRFSEWTALELVKQIIQETTDSGEAFFSNTTDNSKFHPANFLLPKSLIEEKKNIDWKNWTAQIKNCISKLEEKKQIADERYTTKGLLESKQKVGEMAKVYALGIILLQLITHDTDFPWIWNSTDKSLIWENLPYKKIEKTTISSYTLLILHSCFSAKNRESFKNTEAFELFAKTHNNGYDDTLSDSPIISDTDTLCKFISKAQKIIERYQLSMENNAPRQLIPISLLQFSKQNNPLDNANNDIG